MNKTEFEIMYTKNSNISLEEYHKCFITLECNCGKNDCKKWACVCNDYISIKNHIKLYQ